MFAYTSACFTKVKNQKTLPVSQVKKANSITHFSCSKFQLKYKTTLLFDSTFYPSHKHFPVIFSTLNILVR